MYILLLLQQIIASTTHIIAKSLIASLHPTIVLLFRASIASIVYFIFLKIRRTKIFRIERKDYKWFFLLGFLNIPLNQFIFFISLQYTSAPNVALAYALSPAFVLLLSMIFLKERATSMKIYGISIAFIGVIFILFEKGIDVNSANFVGNLFALLASLSWAVYTIIGKNFVIKYGAIYSTAVSMFTGLILYIPIYILFGEKINLASISFVNWLQLLYLGVITSGVAYVLWYYSLKRLEASKVAVFNNLQPVLTTILAMIFFNQELTVPFILGGLMTIGGVILTQRG